MTYKSSGIKKIIVCEECKANLNGKPIYQTIEKPIPKRLCRVCMAKYLDIKEFP